MKILAANAGSTSLKFKLIDFPSETVLSQGRVERIGMGKGAFDFSCGARKYSGEREFASYEEGISLYLDFIGGAEQADAAAFKAVLSKGYPRVHLIDESVIKGMECTMSVAPAHNSAYIAVIRAFQKTAPGLPLVASFETGFHADISEERRVYSVPYEWYSRHGVMRMGYHGASHEGVAIATKGCSRVVSCHLGGSGSICAIKNGRSVDTSFGLSLQCGLPHVNRCGDIDPFIIPYMVNTGMSLDEVMTALTKNSGLKGISGLSGDMRDLRAAENENPRAKLAIQVYITQIVRYIGAYAAEMGGIDALAFTGGIGENDFMTRAQVCESLGFLGIFIDDTKNRAGAERVDSADSKPVFVIKADEETTVCRKAYALLLGCGKQA